MSDQRGTGRPPSHPASRSMGPRTSRLEPPRSPPAQLAVWAVVGVVLVAAGLTLWRRPRTTADAEIAAASPGTDLSAAPGPAVAEDAAPAFAPSAGPVRLSQPRVVGCHDPGPARIRPDECDHPQALEKALSMAIEQAATCVPPGHTDATIEYVADVSFSHHHLRIDLPRAARSVRNRAVVDACAAAVRLSLPASTLDGVEHRHARYKISMIATYRGGG